MDKEKKKPLSSLGEFGLIKFIRDNNTHPQKYHQVHLDIGDDCFCFQSHKNSKYLVTTDILIENTHFKKQWATPEQIGQKAVEVNVSDIASMGNAKPLYVFISLGVPKNIEENYVKRLFKSIKKTCQKYGIHISGGDTVSSEYITISITVIGISDSNIITRSKAKNKDLICTTGTFGDSGAGLDILLKNKKKENLKRFEKNLIKRHLLPQAKITIANLISRNINITSMTDSSDGLFKSIELLTTDNKKGANINLNSIPISKDLQKFTNNNIQKIYNYALFGAEEFELVFTINPIDKIKLQKLVPSISYIGVVNNTNEVEYFENDQKRKIKYSGFKHF
ncbi:MAG: thiamine-phosphate kinase [Endomicrobiaceae bacterium]|nr:thiamine-phosphate kinase [Endomicrobiaceae bacterium]